MGKRILTYSIPTVALRLLNVFGSPQALSNPSIGVLAIFASHHLNDQLSVIFADGFVREHSNWRRNHSSIRA